MEQVLKSLSGHYQKGEFEAAKELLLSNKDGFQKGTFHYNLGTVYSKLGNNAVGRYHLEKAIHEGNESTAVRHNLENIKSKLMVNDITSSRETFDVLLSKGLSYGPDTYLLMTLIFLITSIMLFKKKFFNKITFALLLLISLVPISLYSFYLDKLNVGVTFKDAEVFEGPSGIFEKSGVIPAGSKVIIGKANDGWLFVERPIGSVGWIKSSVLGIIK